jgi:hypothetical protein
MNDMLPLYLCITLFHVNIISRGGCLMGKILIPDIHNGGGYTYETARGVDEIGGGSRNRLRLIEY